MRHSHGEVETLWNGDVVSHGFVEAAGLGWHYVTTGAADLPPVVFLHGFPETWFAWHHQMAALGDSFRCIAIDLPHGMFRSELGVQLIGDGTLVDIAYGRLERPDGPGLVAIPIDDRDLDRIRAEVTAPGVAEAMSASFASASFDGELDDRMNGLFAAMTMPVLFLQGALDPGQQPDEYATGTDEVADGHLQFVDAGHFLHLENPPAVTAAIRAFLERDDLPS